MTSLSQKWDNLMSDLNPKKEPDDIARKYVKKVLKDNDVVVFSK